MLNFVLKRLAIAVPTLLILIVLSYILMYAAPGGPFTREKALHQLSIKAGPASRYGNLVQQSEKCVALALIQFAKCLQ